MPEPAPESAPAPLPLRWALLRHDLPDGQGHWDWLIQRTPAHDSPLLTFRLAHPFDPFGRTVFEALRIPDHRAMYLEYEGPLTENRGSVRRVAAGRAVIELTPDRFRITFEARSGSAHFEAVRAKGDRWRFTRRPA